MRRQKVAVGLVGIAVLFAACGKGGGELPLLPGAQSAGASREMAATDSSASMMVANVRYELADGVSTDAKEAKAYRFADVTKADVERLAKALGVPSAAVMEQEDGWTTGATDGTSVYVSKSGGVFSMATQYAGSGSSGCAIDPVAPDTPVASDQPMPECTPTPTTIPANAPSSASAKKVATDALKAAGVDIDDTKITTESYDGATQNVRFQHEVAGAVVDGFETYVGVGPGDEIISASGYLGDPDEVGSYELATLQRAVERLNQSYQPTTLEARDDMATTAIAPAQPDDAADGGSTASPEPTRPPSDTGLAPGEPTVVKLTSVDVGLMMQSDSDGDLWLVPAYRFGTEDNGTIAAQAADDKYIEKVTAAEPPPVHGGATEPGSTDPAAPANCVDIEGDIEGQVCATAEAKAGEPVVFRITAADSDRGFASGCFDGVDAVYGDDAGGDVRCEACSTDVPPGPGKMGTERSHTYEKPGTYTATFTIRSGADCGQTDPKDSTGKASLTIKVA